MSLILAGLILAGTSGALMVGRLLAKRRGDKPEGDEKKDAEPGDEKARASDDKGAGEAKRGDEKRAEGKPKAPRRTGLEGNAPHLEGFPCQLGDVLIRITGEEAWLAGGIILSEEVPVAVLFVAPEAGQDCAIYVRPAPREVVFWLDPLDPSAVLVAGEPPSSVEHDGVRFDRVRRLPLRPRRIGVGALDLGDAVVVAEYESAGSERLLVFKARNGVSRAFRGVELEPSSFEVIASGRSTLDDD